MKCALCGNNLVGEEIGSQHRDDDGNPICDDCYHEHYEFTCIKCEDYDHIDNQGGIGSLFVAMDEDSLGIPDGVYEVISHPFYADGLIEAHLCGDAVKQLSPETFGVESDFYPMAFLCSDCAAKIRQTIPVPEAAYGQDKNGLRN